MNNSNIGKAVLVDTTLRDGEQAPGVVFNAEEKLHIAELLDSMGITEVEAGFPAIGSEEKETIREIVGSGFKFKSICWCRAIKRDIDAAAETGAPLVNISFPVSDILLNAMGKNRDWLRATLPETISYARDHFDSVYIGAQDATRTAFPELCEFALLAEKSGAQRIRIADTVGIANPFGIGNMISMLKKEVSIPLEFHGHNDMGMATANAVSAIQSGAAFVSATVNGLGERAGNAALEEVAVALKYSLGIESGFDLSKIKELSEFVALASGRNIYSSKPVVGAMAYTHESGIHACCMKRDTRSYQPFSAEETGAGKTEFVFGKHSGTAALFDFLRKFNAKFGKDEAYEILSYIKSLSTKNKSVFKESEIVKIFEERRFKLI